MRALAKEIGVSASLLSLIEQGGHVPPRRLIVALAETLEGNPDEWCALVGRITPEAEETLAGLAKEEPHIYRSFRTLLERQRS